MTIDRRIAGINDVPINKATLLLGGNGSYAHQMMAGSELLQPLLETGGGILFENTPNISIAYGAQYSPVELTHTNYDYQSYGKTSVTNVTVVSKFTARTLYEADYMLGVLHFLRTFSKMGFGENDPYRGNPPAIMKFSAYGAYMINNTPVAIRNFTLQLPEHVDYVQTSFATQVPIYLELSIDLLPMPTPNKVKRDFSLEGFASGQLVNRGYL